MKISDLLALHPSLMTGSELLAHQHAKGISATPAHDAHTNTANHRHNEQATQAGRALPEHSQTGQYTEQNTGQARQSLRQLSHHHSKTHKKPRFSPQHTKQWQSPTHTNNTAKTPAYGQNTGANNSQPQHHHARQSFRQNRHNARPNLPHAGENTSLATAPHAPNQRQKANLARLPDPYSFYSRYLTIKGGGVWRLAVCPFHDDTRPSLSLNMQHGGYICHTCGAKGDRIAFYMHRFNVDFVQACKALELYD